MDASLSLTGKQVNDHSWHKVLIYRNMKEFGLMLDDQKTVNENPLFLERDLDLENKLYVGYFPLKAAEGFVGCIRGLVRQILPCSTNLTLKPNNNYS